jgi:hypothetical protein
MPPERQYFCDCARYCRTLQQVSKRTYFAHAPYRQQQLRTALDDYLHQHNIDPGPAQRDVDDDNVPDPDEEMSDGAEANEDQAHQQNPVQPVEIYDDLYADNNRVPNARFEQPPDVRFEQPPANDEPDEHLVSIFHARHPHSPGTHSTPGWSSRRCN